MSRTVVFACARSNLGSALPTGVELFELPCTGRVSLPLLLGAFATGADGVLVLGRHESTCRFSGAEESARERVARASLLLGLVGISPERLRFVEPEPGPAGPRAALDVFVAALAPLGSSMANAAPAAAALAHEGLDATLALLTALRGQPPEPPPIVDSSLREWLACEGLPVATPATAVLLPGGLPELSLAAGELLRPMRPAALLNAAVAVLTRLGEPVGIARTTVGVGPRRRFAVTRDAVAEAQQVEPWIAARARELPRPVAPAGIACVDDDAATFMEALGHQVVRADEFLLPQDFAVMPRMRLAASAYLAELESRGARALYVSDGHAYCRWAALTRQGAWQSSFILPATGAQLAQLSLARLPLTPALLASPVAARRADVERARAEVRA